MAPKARETGKYNTPLRQAQRDLTRSRIRDAARDLFYEHHYDTTSMDEIAVAAGLRRSTVYLHYKDKAEILTDIITDYIPKGRKLMATLPGPKPNLRQLEKWVGEVAEFVDQERVQLSIILEVRRTSKAHTPVLRMLTGELLAGLGENNVPFRKAAEESADPTLRARAFLLLRELTYACEIYLEETNKDFAKAILQVTAEDFHAFLAKHKG